MGYAGASRQKGRDHQGRQVESQDGLITGLPLAACLDLQTGQIIYVVIGLFSMQPVS